MLMGCEIKIKTDNHYEYSEKMTHTMQKRRLKFFERVTIMDRNKLVKLGETVRVSKAVLITVGRSATYSSLGVKPKTSKIFKGELLRRVSPT